MADLKLLGCCGLYSVEVKKISGRRTGTHTKLTHFVDILFQPPRGEEQQLFLFSSHPRAVHTAGPLSPATWRKESELSLVKFFKLLKAVSSDIDLAELSINR